MPHNFYYDSKHRAIRCQEPKFHIELPIIGGRPLKTGPTLTSHHLASLLFSKVDGEEGKERNEGRSQRTST